MNIREELVKKRLEEKGFKVKKTWRNGIPDLIVNDSIYIEVKNGDCLMPHISSLSPLQETNFKNLKIPILIAYVFDKKYIVLENYVPKLDKDIKGMKQINVWFEDSDHEKLVVEKKKSKLNWHDFLLYLLETQKGGKDGIQKKES